MNKLLIPPSPNWYETDIMACAPDNTVIYGSRQDIVVIKSTPGIEPDDVQVITRAHSTRIKSININRNWGQPHKYAVTVSEDKVVKLWDIETMEKKLSHNIHILQDDDPKIVGASFAGDDRVVSTSESGTVIIWNITKNETNVLRSLFEARTTVTCLSLCPHATWLAAFGLKSGLIVVMDLRKTGKILYKLRGHDKSVVSLSWCPAPINIFPVRPNNKVVEKPLEEVSELIKNDNKLVSDTVEFSEILQKDKNDGSSETVMISSSNESSDNTKEEMINEEKVDRRKQKNPKKTPNPWVGLVHADDDSQEIVNKPTEENDFLKECANLRKDILQMSTPKDVNRVELSLSAQESNSAAKLPLRAILKPRTKSKNSKLSELLLKKEVSVQSETESGQKELVETENYETATVHTPTDRTEVSMELSHSVEKLDPKLTDMNEKSMEITLCGRKESTNTVDTSVSEVDRKEVLALEDYHKESSFDASNTTTSSDGKQFSSVSSCDNDCNCKKHTGAVGKEDVTKSDTSNASETGDVFHDALVCEKADKERAICPPEDSVNFEEQPRKEFLLASSARDTNIYIWRAGTDGRMQTFMTVPVAKNKKKTSRTEKSWITLCWVTPHILLSSSRSAQLLQWTLPKPMVQSKFVRQIHKDHWSVLFNIKAPILYLNEHNFLQKRDVNAWTTGMERTILNTDIGSQKNLGCYHALGGSVNCFSGSPLDPNRLAIGTGEGVINVWDLSREHKKRILFSTFYQKIIASVTALAWHPLIETSLAFATIEGRIGILDTVSKAKSPKLLTHYFKNQVFKIEWGPLGGDVQNPGLFVVCEAKVAIFDPKSHEKEPELLEMPDNVSVYTMSWKPDFSALLVSSKSGSLITYDPDLKIINISYVRHKLQSIIWNPNAVSDDPSTSKHCRTFASLVKHNEIFVYDLGADWVLNEANVVARFDNRGILIKSIEWNPHVVNQLVSVDDGGIAQVYDIESKTVLATYVNPCLDAMISAYWSPVDQDYIITGTTGHKIIVWKVSENAPLTDKEINATRNRITKAQSKEAGDQLIKTKLDQQSAGETEIPKLNKPVKSPILPLFYGLKDKSKVQDLKKLLQWKLGDKTVESNIGDNRTIDVLEIFDDRNNMDRVVDLNIFSFRQKGQHHNANLLTLFKGDISTAVKEAIEQKRVTPWIISMCPMVDPKLWPIACETYANQLQEEAEADPLEIVTYLLACHKVEESVEVLCEKAMFREALVLAKARFGADNSVVSDILDKWARTLVFQGNLEMAAQCYICMGKFEEAASALFRRSSAELLELAVELAKLSGNDELYKAVQFRFNAFKTDGDESKGSSTIVDGSNNENSRDCCKVCQVSGEICTCKTAENNRKSLNENTTSRFLEDQLSGTASEVDKNENKLFSKDTDMEKGPDNDQKLALLEETCKKSEHIQVNLNTQDAEGKSLKIVCENIDTEPAAVEDGYRKSSEGRSTIDLKDFEETDVKYVKKLEEALSEQLKEKEDQPDLHAQKKVLGGKSEGSLQGDLLDALNLKDFEETDVKDVKKLEEALSEQLKEKEDQPDLHAQKKVLGGKSEGSLQGDLLDALNLKDFEETDVKDVKKLEEALSEQLKEKEDQPDLHAQKKVLGGKSEGSLQGDLLDALKTVLEDKSLIDRKMSLDGNACDKEKRDKEE